MIDNILRATAMLLAVGALPGAVAAQEVTEAPAAPETTPAAAPTENVVPEAGTKPKAEAKPAKKPVPAKKMPLETFARLPFVEQATLSPNGLNLAGLFAVEGEQRIAIMPLTKDGIKTVMAVPDETEITSIRWVNDDNIIIMITVLMRVETERWYVSRLIGINRVTGTPTRLLPRMKGQNAAEVLWAASDGSSEILVEAQDTVYTNLEGFWPMVYKVDVETGKQRRVQRGKVNIWDWGADAQGNVRLGIMYDDSSRKSSLLYAREGSGGFRTIDKADLGEDESLEIPFLFVPGTDRGLVFKDNADGRTSIAEVDIVTDEVSRFVFEPEKGDVDTVVMSYDRKKLLGVKTSDDDGAVHWLDPALTAAQKELDGAVKGASVNISSFNRDQSRMIVRVSSPANPGLLFLYDAKSGALDQLATVNKAIGNKRLAHPKMVQYKARDGLEIEGVLTLPKGRAAKNLPFIIMPHGGPWAHDRLTYDYWVQFLVNRGYAVLQPNFRGSTGYGTKFMNAGRGQMGLAMQDDVTDGVSWAVKQGIADPARVCIVGASYGGYAAMWGIAKDPDQYRCAISIAGVADLRREVNDFGSSSRSRLYRDQWKRMTPDFNAVSPIKAVDRIKVPLLLIHGKKDVTVDHVQSKKMHKAMENAGKQVEFVSVPLADHHFTREEDRINLLKSMEDFLAKHNPAD